MKLHFGPTNYPGCFRFHNGTLIATVDGVERKQECYFEHPIKWWIGISFARLFVGIVRTDPTRDARVGSLFSAPTPPAGESK